MDFNRNDSPNNNNNNNDGRKPGGNRPKGSSGTALLITLATVSYTHLTLPTTSRV